VRRGSQTTGGKEGQHINSVRGKKADCCPSITGTGLHVGEDTGQRASYTGERGENRKTGVTTFASLVARRLIGGVKRKDGGSGGRGAYWTPMVKTAVCKLRKS